MLWRSRNLTASPHLQPELLDRVPFSGLRAPGLLVPSVASSMSAHCSPHPRAAPSRAPCHLLFRGALDENNPCHSFPSPNLILSLCLHSGEICFWLGETKVQAASPEMVLTLAGRTWPGSAKRLFFFFSWWALTPSSLSVEVIQFFYKIFLNSFLNRLSVSTQKLHILTDTAVMLWWMYRNCGIVQLCCCSQPWLIIL